MYPSIRSLLNFGFTFIFCVLLYHGMTSSSSHQKQSMGAAEENKIEESGTITPSTIETETKTSITKPIKKEFGSIIDELDGVVVFYNGNVSTVRGRNKTADGYNLGLKYQCVEFVKRYYYEYYNHKMPDTYGHAKSFYDPKLKDGSWNHNRALFQYSNPSKFSPQKGDLLVFDATANNPFGHVAIISEVTDEFIEIIQQNAGPTGSSRKRYDLTFSNAVYEIKNAFILGWLRKVK